MKLTKKQKKEICRIAVSFSLLLLAIALAKWVLPLVTPGGIVQKLFSLALFTPSFLIVGFPVMKSAARTLLHGNFLDENFLMSIASLGAVALGNTTEAVAVMLFYRIGELCQSIAVHRSRESIAALMDLRPETARVLRNGEETVLSPEEVKIGEEIVVFPGEKIPLDGVITEGETTVNTSALTGESLAREAGVGTLVYGGTVNESGRIVLRVERPFAESAVSKILDMVENASERKSRVENFISRFARWYTPLVVALSLSLALLPPIFDGWNFIKWLSRALTFLVISCPCALVVSVPLSFFGGIGGASKCGILVKGAGYLEILAKIDTLVFDKTGTLTSGRFSVVEAVAEDKNEAALLSLAASLESASHHPLAQSVIEAAKGLPLFPLTDIRESAGRGVAGKWEGKEALIGNQTFLLEKKIILPPVSSVGTLLYVALDGKYTGYLLLKDTVKQDGKATVAALRRLGVSRCILLSGDRREIGEEVASSLAMDSAICEVLPNEKADTVASLKSGGRFVGFVGDGINDAPALALADVGIAMGGLGSDAAIEAADVVLMDDALSKLPKAIRIAKKTRGIAHTNIVLALSVKAAFLLLGALGITGMWGAVFADVGVSLLAVLNAMRAMRIPK